MGNIMLPLRFGDGARACYIAKTERISLPAPSPPSRDRIADFVLFRLDGDHSSPLPLSAIIKTGLNAGFIFAVTIAAIFPGRHWQPSGAQLPPQIPRTLLLRRWKKVVI